MILNINSVKIPEQLEILKKPCVPIPQMSAEVRSFVKDMMDTASSHKNCIGLASNQVWSNRDVTAPAIAIIPGTDGWATIINPVIKTVWKKEISDIEGCMSIPNYIGKLKRARHILVSYYDIEMELIDDVHLFDIAAKIFQHEYDHLNGALINEH